MDMDPQRLQQAIEKKAGALGRASAAREKELKQGKLPTNAAAAKAMGLGDTEQSLARYLDDFSGATEVNRVRKAKGMRWKESAGCKKAAMDLSAQRGAALAKAAMADPDFREAAVTMVKEGSFWKNVAVGTAGLALAPVAYGVGSMGMNAVQKAYESLTEGKGKAKAYSEMMKVHKKQLGSEDKSKIQTAFNSLWGLNKDMAKDPLVSGTFVTKAIDYGGVTTQEAGQLISARKGMGEARAREAWMPDARGASSIASGFGKAHEMVGPE
jgi:hypothetical protein